MLPVLLGCLLLAFANGANDNFKGVATLLGSRTVGYRGALAWATLTTLAGSLAAVVLAGELLARFQGKGLVPVELTADPGFLAAVALGAGATVLLASRLGLPTSTTHALVGALVGAGLGAVGAVELGALSRSFLLPLLVSPLAALGGTVVLGHLSDRLGGSGGLGERLGFTDTTCFCVGTRVVETVPAMGPALALEHGRRLEARLGSTVECRRSYGGRLLGVRAQVLVDGLHYASAGAVSFARGLNDTPKIAALLLVLPAVGPSTALWGTGLAIAIGGLLAARRVAETMSFRITRMDPAQGLSANLVTASLVLVASRLGMPVSTTHVSCGALFGLGPSAEGGRSAVRSILLAWLATLPLAALLAWLGVLWLRA